MALTLMYRHELESGKVVFEAFPFQTPTDITTDVLVATSKEEQLRILWNFLVKANWLIEDIREVLDEIRENLKDKKTTLTFI